jgi:hypothetical protein
MKKTIGICVIAFFVSVTLLRAQDESPILKPDIFNALPEVTDSTSGKINIYQDKRIEQLVKNKTEGNPYTQKYATAQGFRVQIFSSNEQRTSKAQAYKIEELVKAKYPELVTYVIYQSPFWKVRVGDFETNSAAQELRNFLREEFPEFKEETYVVRDQIRIPDPF